jgi:hypothetical protein
MLVLIFFQPLDVDDVTPVTVGDDVSAATVLVVDEDVELVVDEDVELVVDEDVELVVDEDVELVVDEDVELVVDVTGVVINIGGNEVVDVDVVMIG